MAAERSATVALMSPGDMGSHLGGALRQAGRRVVTCLDGRSERSRERAAAAGLDVVPSLDDLVEVADLFIAVVPSVAAIPLASTMAQVLRGRHKLTKPLLYVNTNTTGPRGTEEIAHIVEAAGARFVDGSIVGSPSSIPDEAMFFFSGGGADEVTAVVDPPLHCTNLGTAFGRATLLKTLASGLSHGLAALGFELLSTAENLGFRGQLLEAYSRTNPATVSLWERTQPRLPQRARLQAEEITELLDILRAQQVPGHAFEGARTALQAIAAQQDSLPPGRGG